jgi:REP element-mobilizing transposase RayT
MFPVMARKPRLEYAGAVYHVMDRGDRSEDIFHDHEDRRRFLLALGQACGRTGWRVHAFVLMRNHYHLLLETPEPNLCRGMHWLQTTYTVRHNRRHKLHGHLFQGRYKAIPVESGTGDYFATVCDYIHLNPLRAGLLREGKGLSDYAWSSFPLHTLAPSRRPEWLESSRVLAAHGEKDIPTGRRRYRKAIESRAKNELHPAGGTSTVWQSVREAWAFGSEDFRRRLRTMLTEVHATNGATEPSQAWHDEEEAARLVEAGRTLLGIGDFTALPKNHAGKIALAAFAKARTTVANRWLGERLAMGHGSRVSRYCQSAGKNPEVARLMRKLEKAQSKT